MQLHVRRQHIPSHRRTNHRPTHRLLINPLHTLSASSPSFSSAVSPSFSTQWSNKQDKSTRGACWSWCLRTFPPWTAKKKMTFFSFSQAALTESACASSHDIMTTAFRSSRLLPSNDALPIPHTHAHDPLPSKTDSENLKIRSLLIVLTTSGNSWNGLVHVLLWPLKHTGR